MKNKIRFLLFISFAGIHLTTTAQTKKATPVPPKLIPPAVLTSPATAKGPLLSVIDKAARELPLAFEWQLYADTLLQKGDVYRETISFPGEAILTRFMTNDTASLQKSAETDDNAASGIISFVSETASFLITEQQDILTFENTQTKEKQRYKVTLDKSRKKITRLQNLATKRMYLPTTFEGGHISN